MLAGPRTLEHACGPSGIYAFMNYAIIEKAVWISFDDNRTWRKKMAIAEAAGFRGIAIENIESDSASFEALDSLLFNKAVAYQDALFVPRGTVYEPFGKSRHIRNANRVQKRVQTSETIRSEPGTIYNMFKKRNEDN